MNIPFTPSWFERREREAFEIKQRVLGRETSPGGYFVARRTLLGKLLKKLFPKDLMPAGDYLYGVTSCVDMHFDWKDRLRILVSGHVYCEVRVETGQSVAVKDTTCVFFVEEPSGIGSGLMSFEKDLP